MTLNWSTIKPAAIAAVAYAVIRELAIDVVLNKPSDWVWNNAGVVGEFLAWRWSTVIISVIIGGGIYVVATILDKGRRVELGPGESAIKVSETASIKVIEAAETAKANVVFDGFSPVKDQPISWGSRQSINQPTKAEFARLRFVNEVDIPSAGADVPNLHAVIEISDADGTLLLTVPDARWADNPDRGASPSRDTKSVNLPSTGETRVLDIAMRPYGFNECYGWDHNGQMISEPSIPTGVHQVSVELTGTNMPRKRRFTFVLDNPLGHDAEGVIEESWLELVEPAGSDNSASAQRLKRRAPELLSHLEPLIGWGNSLLERYGRPQSSLGTHGLKDIGDWIFQSEKAIKIRCPDFLAEYKNDGQIYNASIVSVKLLEGRLARLGEIIKDIRLR